MSFNEALAWLYSTQAFGIKPGLDNMRRLMAALGVRPDALRCIHVAGTNGKGSVCAMIEAVCRAAGLRTGLFTSPHLVHFRERIRIGMAQIPEAAVVEGLERVRTAASGWTPHPTFFEITTALALDYFARSEVELAVIETGMGGRLDATNVIVPLACAVTSIGLDHQAHLGETAAAIAREKAGIFKPGVPAVAAPQEEAVAAVLRQVAARQGAPLRFVDRPLEGIAPGLRGPHQRWNAALALAALEAAGLALPEPAVRRGLETVEWRGRFQIIGDVVLDGAHNAPAARALVETWRTSFPAEVPCVILGAMADKDYAAVIRELLPLQACFIVTKVNSPRAAGTAALAEALHRAGVQAVETATGIGEALDRARRSGRRILVTGSLYLVGETLALLEGGDTVERSLQ